MKSGIGGSMDRNTAVVLKDLLFFVAFGICITCCTICQVSNPKTAIPFESFEKCIHVCGESEVKKVTRTECVCHDKEEEQ
jgi:hypothetical protein